MTIPTFVALYKIMHGQVPFRLLLRLVALQKRRYRGFREGTEKIQKSN